MTFQTVIPYSNSFPEGKLSIGTVLYLRHNPFITFTNIRVSDVDPYCDNVIIESIDSDFAAVSQETTAASLKADGWKELWL
jgi:hypothetical protein